MTRPRITSYNVCYTKLLRMEFCGGHTHAIFRYGVQDLMPDNVQFVHGPGCPVCVLPIGRIDNAIQLAEAHGAILCSYGDMLRVPASGRRSLLKAKAAGADIRMVYRITSYNVCYTKLLRPGAPGWATICKAIVIITLTAKLNICEPLVFAAPETVPEAEPHRFQGHCATQAQASQRLRVVV